jgi:hypothetical protein
MMWRIRHWVFVKQWVSSGAIALLDEKVHLPFITPPPPVVGWDKTTEGHERGGEEVLSQLMMMV